MIARPRLVSPPALAVLVLALAGCSHGRSSPGATRAPQPYVGSTVKVAVVHFAPRLRDVPANRETLVALTAEAAQNGAKIIVHTEMATSGYSYFSRADIATVAETVPGPTTAALGQIARQYGVYVVVGLPVVDAKRHLFYNSAVLIEPNGEVGGVYRKRNNLLEASYNAAEFGPLPTFDTPYGRLAIVICADLFYSQFPRLAAIAGADILLAPANVGVTLDFLKVRVFEDQLHLLVANRYGEEERGTPNHVFNQNTFTIPLPFNYNFNHGSRSVIMTSGGHVLAELSEPRNAIRYGDLPIRKTHEKHRFPVVRRPDMYALMGQDTLEQYTFTQLQLPTERVFAAAAVDPGAAADPWQAALTAAQQAVAAATARGQDLELIVYPAGYLQQPDPQGVAQLQAFAATNDVDLVVHFGGTVPPSTQLLTPSGDTYTYRRTHREPTESIPPDQLGDEFLVVDRDYARLALLQDRDLYAPETSVVMAKMGVDVIAVNADSSATVLSALWQARTGDYLHLVVANRQGKEGVYLGGYRASPSSTEADGMAFMQIDTSHVRSKKEPRFLDFRPLLMPCHEGSC